MDVLQTNFKTTGELFDKNVTGKVLDSIDFHQHFDENLKFPEYCYPGCTEVIVHSDIADSILLDVNTKEHLTYVEIFS